MKNQLSLLAFFLFFVGQVQAQTLIDGMYYNLDRLNQTASVSKVPTNASKYSGSIDIPGEVMYEGTVYSVTGIGDDAFSFCANLNNIVIPRSVISIGNWAFSYCTGLTTLKIPYSVTSIATSAFYGCSNLSSIDVEQPNFTYRSDNNAIIEQVTSKLVLGCKNTVIPTYVKSIGTTAFGGCSELKNISIPNSVTSIEIGAFEECSGLTSVVIPNSVTNLGPVAFFNCSNLESVTIGNSVQNIEYWAFYQCPKLSAVKIGSAVKNIERLAFAGCHSLTSIEIPNSVTNIDNAFDGSINLTNIHMLSSTPPTASSAAFNGCTNLTCIYVPKDAAVAYNVEPWNSYEIVEFTDTWTISDNGATAYTETPNFTANVLNYTRNFTHTGWQALYVPFDIPYDAISDKFDVAELNMFHQYDDNNDGDFDRTELEVLRLKAGSTIEHHTPYVIRAKETGEQTVTLADATAYRAEEKEFECMSLKRRYVFHGTYSGVSGADMLAGGYYALSNGELCRAASASAALGGFRWYVSVTDRATGLPVSPAALPAKMRIVEWGEEGGEATGIAAAPADAPRTAAAPVYDLNGRRVGTADAMDALPKGVYIVNGKKAIR